MTIYGIDYAWGRPGPAAIKAARINDKPIEFVCRYLSHDTTGKNLTKAEADVLAGAGLWVVVVWETTAQRALAGHSAGAADARFADAQARACGMPDGRPIYFAVDWDATAGQQDEINAYLDGAASVLGRDRVGLYAGYWPVKRAFDAKKITWAWQTYGWSGGHWDGRAQLQQYSNSHTLNGVGVDYDRATTGDYGQWKPGVSPKPQEDDMPYTEAQLKKLVHDAVYEDDVLPAPGSNPTDTFNGPGFDPKTNPTWAGKSFLKQTVQGLQMVNGKVDALAEKVDAIQVGGVDVDALAARLAPLVADVLAKRLES